MMRQPMTWTCAGLVAGLIVALGATRLLTGLLYGIPATDPWTFAAIALLLTATAGAACWIPARRASRIDPLTALREE